MTVNETAQALQMSPWTIRNLCRLGKLPAKRKRKEWFIPKPLVRALVKEKMEGGVPNEAYLEWLRDHPEQQSEQPTQTTL